MKNIDEYGDELKKISDAYIIERIVIGFIGVCSFILAPILKGMWLALPFLIIIFAIGPVEWLALPKSLVVLVSASFNKKIT